MKHPYLTLAFLLAAPSLTACTKSTFLLVEIALTSRKESQSSYNNVLIEWVAWSLNFSKMNSNGNERGNSWLFSDESKCNNFRPLVEVTALLDYIIIRIMYEILVSWFIGNCGTVFPYLTTLKYFSNSSVKFYENFCWSLLYNCSYCGTFSNIYNWLLLKLKDYWTVFDFVGVLFLGFCFTSCLLIFYVCMFSIYESGYFEFWLLFVSYIIDY